MNRREFLKLTGFGTAGVGALGLFKPAAAGPIAQDKRSYVAGKFALELDNQVVGWVYSAAGGNATADVVNEKLGPDHIVKKHLGHVKYQPIVIQCGTGMSKPFYQWLKASFDRNYQRKNGAIVACDFNYNEMSRLTFQNALVTEVGFPALDAASKDAAKLTVTFAPEITRFQKGSGRAPSGASPGSAVLQKKWLPANFRLKIAGLEEACSRVNKIDEIVIAQKVVENPVGELRDYEREPAHLEIPNLVFTVPESHADSILQWYQDFVIKGNNGDAQEKTGTLEYLTPNLQEALFTLTFRHLGIFNVEPEKIESGVENVRRYRVSMYCEDMSFDAPGASA